MEEGDISMSVSRSQACDACVEKVVFVPYGFLSGWVVEIVKLWFVGFRFGQSPSPASEVFHSLNLLIVEVEVTRATPGVGACFGWTHCWSIARDDGCCSTISIALASGAKFVRYRI